MPTSSQALARSRYRNTPRDRACESGGEWKTARSSVRPRVETRGRTPRTKGKEEELAFLEQMKLEVFGSNPSSLSPPQEKETQEKINRKKESFLERVARYERERRAKERSYGQRTERNLRREFDQVRLLRKNRILQSWKRKFDFREKVHSYYARQLLNFQLKFFLMWLQNHAAVKADKIVEKHRMCLVSRKCRTLLRSWKEAATSKLQCFDVWEISVLERGTFLPRVRETPEKALSPYFFRTPEVGRKGIPLDLSARRLYSLKVSVAWEAVQVLRREASLKLIYWTAVATVVQGAENVAAELEFSHPWGKAGCSLLLLFQKWKLSLIHSKKVEFYEKVRPALTSLKGWKGRVFTKVESRRKKLQIMVTTRSRMTLSFWAIWKRRFEVSRLAAANQDSTVAYPSGVGQNIMEKLASFTSETHQGKENCPFEHSQSADGESRGGGDETDNVGTQVDPSALGIKLMPSPKLGHSKKTDTPQSGRRREVRKLSFFPLTSMTFLGKEDLRCLEWIRHAEAFQRQHSGKPHKSAPNSPLAAEEAVSGPSYECSKQRAVTVTSAKVQVTQGTNVDAFSEKSGSFEKKVIKAEKAELEGRERPPPPPQSPNTDSLQPVVRSKRKRREFDVDISRFSDKVRRSKCHDVLKLWMYTTEAKMLEKLMSSTEIREADVSRIRESTPEDILIEPFLLHRRFINQ